MSLMEPLPRETTVEAGGQAKGVAVAIVSQNKDDSGLGRVKVRYPWHSKPLDSYWARVATPMAGKERGLYFIPEIGDEVLVAFERGDVRFPYVVGSLWNGVDKTPESNDDGANDIRVIHTRKGHTLFFDDGAKGVARLELNDGKKLEIDDDGVRLEDGAGNSLTIESKSGSLTINAANAMSLKATRIAIEASGTLEVKAGALLSLSGGLVKIN